MTLTVEIILVTIIEILTKIEKEVNFTSAQRCIYGKKQSFCQGDRVFNGCWGRYKGF
ncbi:hypothetical protein IPdc08_01563 [archaeon]|nr:hypothetical protein IPdc08_01563 [archaeon]